MSAYRAAEEGAGRIASASSRFGAAARLFSASSPRCREAGESPPFFAVWREPTRTTINPGRKANERGVLVLMWMIDAIVIEIRGPRVPRLSVETPLRESSILLPDLLDRARHRGGLPGDALPAAISFGEQVREP